MLTEALSAYNQKSRRAETTRAATAMPSLGMIRFAMPPEKIALFKAIVESYDNLATLRTENPQTHRLCIYFDADSRDEVLALFNSLIEPFAITRIETA